MAVSLATLNEELAQLTAERAELREKNPGTVMSDEARARDAEIVDRVKRVTARIEEEQQRERDALMTETARYMDDPHYRVPKAVNADDEGRKTMRNAGWDIRGGRVYRQTSLGEINYGPESMFFGPIPSNDPVSARTYKEQRASLQPEYRNVFLKYIQAKGDVSRLTSAEQNALSEGDAADGGYLVPADIQAEILVRRTRSSVMRSLASIRQTSRNVYQIPAVVPNGSSGSIYSSGFVGGLVGERPAQTDNGPTFQRFEIDIRKYEAYTKVTNDLIDDAASDILAFLAEDGGRNLGLVEDNYFLTGNGTGLQPLGLLSASLSTFDVEGSTSDTVTNSVSNAGSAPKIVAGYYELPQQYSENATWLMSRATQGLVHALVDGDGRPWWQPQLSAGGEGSAPPVLVGAPVRTSAFMPEDGTNGNKVMVIGDFSNFLIADRAGISVNVDRVNLVGTDETQIFLRSRTGSGVWNTDAFRVGIV